MSRIVYMDFKTVKAAVSTSQIIDHCGLTERFKRSDDGARWRRRSAAK